MPEAMLALIGCVALIGFFNHAFSDSCLIALIGFSNSPVRTGKVANQTNLRPILHVVTSIT